MRTSSDTQSPLVAIVAYNRLCMFEFGIALEAFALPRPELKQWYDCVVVAGEPGPWQVLGGMTAVADAGLERLHDADTVVIPGWRNPQEAPPQDLLLALQEASRRGARFLSICTGAFVLAEAGLLDNRRATTHWAYAPAFRERFPRITLEPDVLYVDDGNVITSAGSTAGIDTCLHVIRQDHGAAVANHVARTLVMPPHREGGQAQFTGAPVAVRPERALSDVLEWARERLDSPITVSDLAGRAAMSERTLLRRFVEVTGLTPKAWLTKERTYRARLLLESTDMTLDAVAEACGFRSQESFRSAFRRTLKIAPMTYRRQFQAQHRQV
ncbi:transcriptional regulator FtrA [Alkalilimnicola ehrlichii]|uniref:Transcriptional regulator FtrA n=1 Tax=Alkalilimnicola ehrlichii TaxID=351052 RepID=A0A3E0WLE1_9GAMM|nr:transcriptional regulator FtrA [Alkalilimnicola ehrlichii]RFA26244.1 transcriptional regulator FtrA [Alkalilimnicola ehrlichii]RFA33229.1 transcriptional regulator FtrA [Alkalilimnicola ehrlichii]